MTSSTSSSTSTHAAAVARRRGLAVVDVAAQDDVARQALVAARGRLLIVPERERPSQDAPPGRVCAPPALRATRTVELSTVEDDPEDADRAVVVRQDSTEYGSSIFCGCTSGFGAQTEEAPPPEPSVLHDLLEGPRAEAVARRGLGGRGPRDNRGRSMAPSHTLRPTGRAAVWVREGAACRAFRESWASAGSSRALSSLIASIDASDDGISCKSAFLEAP